ncbi:MAG TPA: hypothetical protein VEG31_04345 [Thermoproteota archaeon]|nr:hypothetical protein [Thermoproteota archaeon]
MSVVLGTSAPLASDLNLLLQLIVLVLLAFGYMSGKKKDAKSLATHGRIMTLATGLSALGFLLVMVPSFVNYFTAPGVELFAGATIITSLHTLIGIFGGVLAIAFALNKKPKNLVFWMRATLWLWVINIVLGVVLYLQIAGVF